MYIYNGISVVFDYKKIYLYNYEKRGEFVVHRFDDYTILFSIFLSTERCDIFQRFVTALVACHSLA